jgi:HAD superfamily hydrolase (TIGR01509 family)
MEVRLIIFDCDGVLVDSEPIALGTWQKMLGEIGLHLSFEETIRRFQARPMKVCVEIVEHLLGKKVPHGFVEQFHARTFETFQNELQPVEGIFHALDGISIPICVASSGGHDKMRLTLGKTGLYSHFEGRIFSTVEVARGKPFPDLFLYAAEKMGVSPRDCVVVEDSLPGVEAGVAAGMTVFGYAKLANHNEMRACGAHVFDDMRCLPEMLEMVSAHTQIQNVHVRALVND